MRPITLVFILLTVVSCGAQGGGAAAPSQVLLTHGEGGSSTVAVEIADTEEERSLGLMFRESLASDSGMLFLFESDTTTPFYMKNTLISLDILFISSALKIVTIAADTVPFSLDLIRPTGPYRYVLEVRAGYAKAHGLAIGDTVTLKL